MKRLAMSLVAIAVVSTFAIAATRAYFTYSVAASGNTFASGTLTLTVSGPNNQATKIFSISNLSPGHWASAGPATLKNTGSVDGYAWMEIKNVQPPKSALGNLVKVSVEKDKDWDHKYDMPKSLNKSAGDRVDLGEIKKGKTLPVTLYAFWPNGSPSTDNQAQGQIVTFDVVFHLDQKM